MINDRIIKKIQEITVVGNGGFTSFADAEGPVSGYDPLMKFRSKNKKVDYRKVPMTWRKWVESLDD